MYIYTLWYYDEARMDKFVLVTSMQMYTIQVYSVMSLVRSDAMSNWPMGN